MIEHLKAKEPGKSVSWPSKSKGFRTKPIVPSLSKTKDLRSWVKVRDGGESPMQAPESKHQGQRKIVSAPEERDNSPSLCLSVLSEHSANRALS